MSEIKLAEELANYQGKGYVIAPAGFGKTHLIALAVKASEKRQLILTHTYAGVNALRKKMKLLEVPSSKYEIATIASWILKICLSYPKSSGWNIKMPEGIQWNDLYLKGANLLEKRFIKRILQASYSGLFVDEYQDCTLSQHEFICSLSNILYCRLLGDPLQAIFDFAETTIDWERNIVPSFEKLGELTTPWRWNNANSKELGEWLIKVRQSIIDGNAIELNDLPPQLRIINTDLDDFRNPARLSAFYSLLREKGSVIAIHAGAARFKTKTHALARSLNGKYSSIEEIEGAALFSFITKITKAETHSEKLKHIIEFSKQCMTGVDQLLTAATKRGEKTVITRTTRAFEITNAANNYLDDPSSSNILALLFNIKNANETRLFRRDLFYRLVQVLRMHSSSQESLKAVADRYQTEFRQSGRPLKYSKIIGTTLLIKGLEYDHAIVLSPKDLSDKELYVALTRGSKSLTICTIYDKLFLKNDVSKREEEPKEELQLEF